LARARERLAQMKVRAGLRGADADHPQARASELRPIAAREVMTAEVVAVAPEATLRAVSELMSKHRIGAVPVVDLGGRVLGLVTDRDIVVRAVAARRDIDQVRAGDIMSIGIECADPDTPVEALREKMVRFRVR